MAQICTRISVSYRLHKNRGSGSVAKLLARDEGGADCGEYCEVARAFAQAVIRSVELIVQPDAQLAFPSLSALGPTQHRNNDIGYAFEELGYACEDATDKGRNWRRRGTGWLKWSRLRRRAARRGR